MGVALDVLIVGGGPVGAALAALLAHGQFSVRLIEALGVAHHFAANCGRDTFPVFKPDPRHLTLTIERAGGSPHRAVMVGDSRTDIVTAQAARIPSIAVPFGYTDVPVRRLNPDLVIGHFDELFDAVGTLVRLAAA